MTSEEEERLRFVTGGYRRHRRQWVKIHDPMCPAQDTTKSLQPGLLPRLLSQEARVQTMMPMYVCVHKNIDIVLVRIHYFVFMVESIC